MRQIKILHLFLIAIFILISSMSVISYAAEEKSSLDNGGVLYYFWGYCPTCGDPDEHVWLFEDYPINVEIYEVFYDEEGRKKYEQVTEEMDITARGFPTVVYRDQYWLGFSPAVQEEITGAIEAYLENREVESRAGKINVPLVGEFNLEASPILLTTMIIAFLDGFNPCSLFVLTFLLAIIVHSASRKRIFIVGITFLLVTSAVYGLFMLGVLNIMIFVTQLFWIRNLIAAIVIILGIVAIKDFLVYKEGFSFAIPDSYKSKYYKQVRRVFYTESVLPMIAATAVMALGIALVELPCTAGFPFIWSSIIAGLDLPVSYFIILFILYILIYLSVELAIFFIAVIRMRSIKMTEEKGRLLKLIGGSLMLVLGLILFIEPTFMESMIGILVAFASSAALVLVIYYINRLIKYFGEKTG